MLLVFFNFITNLSKMKQLIKIIKNNYFNMVVKMSSGSYWESMASMMSKSSSLDLLGRILGHTYLSGRTCFLYHLHQSQHHPLGDRMKLASVQSSVPWRLHELEPYQWLQYMKELYPVRRDLGC